MLNIIKMDLYRMLKSKITLVMLLITIVFSILTVYIAKLDIKLMQENAEYQEQLLSEEENSDGVVIGVQMVGSSSWLEENYKISVGELFFYNVASGILLILITVFAVVFTRAEEKHGYIKTINGQARNRGSFFLSNIMIISLFSIFILAIELIILPIASKIVFGYVSFAGTGGMTISILVQILLHVAFGILMSMLCILIRNSGAAITIGICAASGTFGIVSALVNYVLIKKIGVSASFDLSNYMLTGNVKSVTEVATNSILVRSVVVGIIYVIISVVIGITISKKRDVK